MSPQLARQVGQAVEIASRISGLDSDVPALGIAQFTQRLQECLIRWKRRGMVCEEAKAMKLRLLRLGGGKQPDKPERDPKCG